MLIQDRVVRSLVDRWVQKRVISDAKVLCHACMSYPAKIKCKHCGKVHFCYGCWDYGHCHGCDESQKDNDKCASEDAKSNAPVLAYAAAS